MTKNKHTKFFLEIGESKKEYTILFLLGLILIFFRSAYNVSVPVLYAEDGFWLADIINDGFFHTLLNARPDYLVVGNILLLEIAFLLNQLFCGDNLVYMPNFVAFIQYMFFSAVALLPVICFKREVRKSLRYIAWFSVLMVPLGDDGGEIFGKILNVGYVFYFIAFCFLYYRICNKSKLSKIKIVLIDVTLLVCCGTNPACYVLVGCGFLVDSILQYRAISVASKGNKVPVLLKQWNMHFYNKMWVFLGVLCFSCALYDMIILNSTYTNSFSIFNGTTKITIEFFARQLLFYWIYPVYHALNDVVVVGVFVLVTIVLVVLFHSANISRENKIKLAVCVGATLIYSLITTIARGGLLVPYLNNYMTTMVDKYYYGLNIMTLIPIMFITEDLVKVRHWWGKGIGMIVSAWMVLSPVITLETMVEFTDPAMEGVTHEVSFRERLCTGFFDAQRDAYTVYIDPVGWHMNLPSKYVHASVQGKRHAQPLVVADITDQNWNNGVGMAIGIENGLLFTQESGEVLKYCDTLMAGSEEVKIMEVESSGEWIYVVCDTTDLDAFAYPNEITFTLKGSTGE